MSQTLQPYVLRLRHHSALHPHLGEAGAQPSALLRQRGAGLLGGGERRLGRLRCLCALPQHLRYPRLLGHLALRSLPLALRHLLRTPLGERCGELDGACGHGGDARLGAGEARLDGRVALGRRPPRLAGPHLHRGGGCSCKYAGWQTAEDASTLSSRARPRAPSRGRSAPSGVLGLERHLHRAAVLLAGVLEQRDLLGERRRLGLLAALHLGQLALQRRDRHLQHAEHRARLGSRRSRAPLERPTKVRMAGVLRADTPAR
eukprot:scaffold51164_cov59-Phaeocystis_antarctica.AAC.2